MSLKSLEIRFVVLRIFVLEMLIVVRTFDGDGRNILLNRSVFDGLLFIKSLLETRWQFDRRRIALIPDGLSRLWRSRLRRSRTPVLLFSRRTLLLLHTSVHPNHLAVYTLRSTAPLALSTPLEIVVRAPPADPVSGHIRS